MSDNKKIVDVGDVIDSEKLLSLGETGIESAKRNGRNRVETLDGTPGIQVRLPNF